MTPSDFLTVLGLALAVWAIIPNKERRFIRLFFARWEIRLLVINVLIIHYFMAFNWLQANWLPQLEIFTTTWGLPSQSWAYVVTIFSITYPVMKVSSGYFSHSRLQDLLNLYDALLEEGDTDLLSRYIRRYHMIDIRTYLQAYSHFSPPTNRDILLNLRTQFDIEHARLLSSQRMDFAQRVYRQILQDERYITAAANRDSDIFATVLSGIETPLASNQALAISFVRELFKSQSLKLVAELKILNESNGSINHLSEFNDLAITSCLFANTEVAAEHYVWEPVGEETIRTLHHDEDQRRFLKRRYDSQLDNLWWNQKAYLAVVYFNTMVRETIYRDGGWHMWLHFYARLTVTIIKIIPEKNRYDLNREFPAFGHQLIHTMVSNMLDWLRLAKDLNTVNQVVPTAQCIGTCVFHICEASSGKIGRRFQVNIVDMILHSYFDLGRSPDNVGADAAVAELRRVLGSNEGPSSGRSASIEYVNTIRQAFLDFDFIKYDLLDDDPLLLTFKQHVLTPLGITD